MRQCGCLSCGRRALSHESVPVNATYAHCSKPARRSSKMALKPLFTVGNETRKARGNTPSEGTTKALPSSFRSGGLLPYSVRLGWGNLLAFMTAALFVLQARSEQDPWLRGSCHPLGQHSFRIPGPAVCPASRGPQRARHASSARAQRRTPGRTAHKAWRRLRHTSDPSGAAFASSLAS